ncbi:MAG: Maf family protein, partial [bacterium]
DEKIDPLKLARRLSAEKAKAVAKKHTNAIIIAADTFISFRGKLLGKPHTNEEARKMLKMLTGKSHSVVTGYTIIDTAQKKKVSRSVETRVWFKKMTNEEIESYIHSGEPLDKAGAYAIQGLGAVLIKKIEGDFFNVVGLPLFDLVQQLKKFGIHVFER